MAFHPQLDGHTEFVDNNIMFLQLCMNTINAITIVLVDMENMAIEQRETKLKIIHEDPVLELQRGQEKAKWRTNRKRREVSSFQHGDKV